MSEILIGEVRAPSGTLMLVDPQTLDVPEAGDGQAGIVEGVPTDRPIRLFVTPSTLGPWIDALRLEIEAGGAGEDDHDSILCPMVHQVLILDADAADRFELGPDSHYGQVVAAIGEAPAAVATVGGMTVAVAMIALQAVEDLYRVMVRRGADGAITQIAVTF